MTTIDRTTTIGGSDVAAILGLSPWRSPLDVWREKALGEPDDRDTPAMQAGGRMALGRRPQRQRRAARRTEVPKAQ